MLHIPFGSSFFISTHALTEGDDVLGCPLLADLIFQLTPSRRATFFVCDVLFY